MSRPGDPSAFLVEAEERYRAAAEAVLMARIAAADRKAPLIALYDRYASSVYRLGIRM